MAASALGLSTVNGLPAHVLIVHLVVVFVPLSAVLLLASLRPSVARRLGGLLPATAAVSLLSVFAAMNAGDWLEQHVGPSSQLRHHTELGGQLWPFSLAVFLLATAVWWFSRTTGDAGPEPTPQGAGRRRAVATGLLAVVVALLSVIWVVRIGDSGSRSAWQDKFSHAAVSHG